jgi:hypothetical protein
VIVPVPAWPIFGIWALSGPIWLQVAPPLVVPMTWDVVQLLTFPQISVPSTQPWLGEIQLVDWATKPAGTGVLSGDACADGIDGTASAVVAGRARQEAASAAGRTLHAIRRESFIDDPNLHNRSDTVRDDH